MYKVLIVDDERLIREGLRTIIDWEAYGFTVADTAADAAEALNKLETLRPELVIADIRMPGMDGLKLIRTVLDNFETHPHFLILSGYADFNYARTAMQMQVDGYMLKPVDEEELITYLNKLKPILEGEKRSAEAVERSPEQLVSAMLSGEEISVTTAEEAGLLWKGYELFLVQPQTYGEVATETVQRIKSALSDTYRAASSGVVFLVEPYIGILHRKEKGDVRPSGKIVQAVGAACRKENVSFTAVTGGTSERLPEVEALYRHALDLMKFRFVLDDERICDRAPEGVAEPSAEAHAEGLEEREEKLFLMLDVGNTEAAAALLREAGGEMLAAGVTEQGIKTAFSTMLASVIGKLSQSRPEIRAKGRAFSAQLIDIHREFRYFRMLERLSGLISAIAGELQTGGTEQQIRKMTDLIRRNYKQNLKLETLAEVLNYNSSYLGKMFKTATGENFNTYLDKVRIEKAKELLEQGMKVYQVAEQVGYSNVDYFHGKFRKYVGSSPSSYRKK